MTTCPNCSARSIDGHLCHQCSGRLRRDLRELPWLYLQARHAALGLVRLAAGGGGGGTLEPPLPVNLRASRLTDRIRSGLIGWARIAHDELGCDWPEPRIGSICEHLAASVGELRKHEAAAELANDVAAWTHKIVALINRPPTRRIEVGPCPLDTTTDGETARCTGVVWAILPSPSGDGTEAPAHAACSWCCDPDAEPMVGLWVAEQWRTLGRLMVARSSRDAERRLLALAVGRTA